MGTAIETLKRRAREWLRSTTAAPALPDFSIRLCWPLSVSTASPSRQAAPLVATLQLSLGRRPVPAVAQAVVKPRRHVRRSGDTVRQLQAMLRAARREADREFARSLLEHRQDHGDRSVVAVVAGAGPDTRLRITPPGYRLRAMVPPQMGAESFQSWILLCISRADGMALRWQQRRPRHLALLAARPRSRHRPEL